LLQTWIREESVGSSEADAPRSCTFLKSVNSGGVLFTPASEHPNDSQIVFGAGVPQDWSAGYIQSIFAVSIPLENGVLTRQTFCVVNVLKDLPEDLARDDPYRRFPIAGGRLYQQKTARVKLLRSSEIISHFAGTPDILSKLNMSHIHVLPLDKQ